jgi:predicted PurR-regulated permease PerM
LGLRIRSITPGGLMRFFLFLGALTGIGWLISVTWVWLVPFGVGAVIAYILLPLVNWLNRWMPRILAVILALTLTLAATLLFFVLLVPSLVEQFYRIYLNLPRVEEMRSYLYQLDQYIATLPAPTQETVSNVYTQAVEKIRSNVGLYVSGLVNLIITVIFGIFSTISFLLGFLVVPGWLLMILQHQRRGVQTLNRLLPAWLAPDFWGVMRIFNRTLSAFVRGQLLLALAVTALTYLGLVGLAWQLGLQGENLLRYQLLLAMIAGLMQLIPTIGPFLGAIPAVLLGFANSTELGVGIILVYLLVQLIILYFVAPYVERSIIDIHPAILLIVIVALSVFSIWWVLLAAPVTAIVRDLYLYVYGRFSDPPRPAGLLPGEPLPVSQPRAAAETQRIPLAYRHSRATR